MHYSKKNNQSFIFFSLFLLLITNSNSIFASPKQQKKNSLISLARKACLTYLSLYSVNNGNSCNAENVRFMVKQKDNVGKSHNLRMEPYDNNSSNNVESIIENFSDNHSSKIAGKLVRKMGNGYKLYEIENSDNSLEVDELINTIKNDPMTENVILDFKVETFDKDPLEKRQWHLNKSPGINVQKMWDQGFTGKGNIIAVVDTGLVAHEDLTNQVVGGYDFISDRKIANDDQSNEINDRDSDYGDPGDATKDYECGLVPGRDSSWHGTHVAGIALAIRGNDKGGSGVAPDAKLLVVRALGKCGGNFADIIDGVFWAAGYHIDGVPTNQNPANIINLSLGGSGYCDSSINSVFKELKDNGVIVVVAAGNADQNLDEHPAVPASCKDVFTVAATGPNGKIASYSNTGSPVDLAAPGGDYNGGILAPIDGGADEPNYDNSYGTMMGTSMATPVVSGAFALIREMNNNSNTDVSEYIKTLKSYSTEINTNDDSINFNRLDFDYNNTNSGSSRRLNSMLFIVFAGVNTLYFIF